MTVQDPPAGASLRLSTPSLRLALVLGGFTLLTLLFFRPWTAQLSSALLGPPEDNMQDFWNSWHVVHAQSWRDLFFTHAIRFPQGTSLAYHSFAWPQVFAVALLARLSGDDFTTIVALQNLTLLASFPLAAAAMFYLARHFLRDDLGAAVAAFIFAFNPWHVAQVVHHAHVSGIEFLPVFLLCYLRALDSKDWQWLASAAVMQALSALSCWYFLFYTLYFFAFQLLYQRIQDRRWPRGWTLAAPALCTMAALLLLSPWLIPMLTTSSASLYYVGGNMFVADLAALFAFPPTHLLARFGSGIYAAITGNAWEGTVYLGLVNVALLIWACTRPTTDKSKKLLTYALSGAIFFLVISAGEALHVAGRVTPLHLPGVILSHLPFFANVRTPARAMVMVFLFGGLAVGYAVTLLKDHKAAAVAILMLVDFMPVNLASTSASCPPALAAIAADHESTGVLDLPRGYEAGNAAMMLAACHGHPIVAGETARQMGATLLDHLNTQDLAAQQRQLAAAHVRYVILHRAKDGVFSWSRRDGGRDAYEKQYRAIGRDGALTILQVY